MESLARHGGFTLVEIMIVVLVIGIVVGLARPAMQRTQLRARAAAYWNDCRVFAAAFHQYAAETGDFPPDQKKKAAFPTGMVNSLNNTQWLRETPLGGFYNWDAGTKSHGQVLDASIRVDSVTLSMTELQLVDNWFDDGNLATGVFQVAAAGTRAIYVME